MIIGVITSLLPQSQALGLTNAEDLAALRREVEAEAADPTIYFRWPILTGSWAVRPA